MKAEERDAALRALAACLDSVTAEANGDVAMCGQWRCDYSPHLATYRSQIDSMLGLKNPERGLQEQTDG